MTPDLETALGAAHQPGFGREIQRMAPCRAATDFARLAPPHRIMPMARADQRVGNFMEDGIADVIIAGMPHIMPRQGNLTPPIITLTGAPARIVKPHCPVVKPMFAHQDGGGIERSLEGA